jgi:hypothetical protein
LAYRQTLAEFIYFAEAGRYGEGDWTKACAGLERAASAAGPAAVEASADRLAQARRLAGQA